MILLVFVAAVLVSVFLERQARQHKIQRGVEYERRGIPVPPPRPKLKRTEAWLNLGLGVLLGLVSLMFAWAGFGTMNVAERMPDHASTINDSAVRMIEGGAFFLASGIALARLGWKAIREIAQYESGATGGAPYDSGRRLKMP